MFVTKNEQDGRIDLGDFGYVPTIARREVNTAVLVDDGQTVVIGGVYEFKDSNDVSKIPFLGDIPFLGNLFKRKTRTKEKDELLVFVTPKILRVAQRNGGWPARVRTNGALGPRFRYGGGVLRFPGE